MITMNDTTEKYQKKKKKVPKKTIKKRYKQ